MLVIALFILPIVIALALIASIRSMQSGSSQSGGVFFLVLSVVLLASFVALAISVRNDVRLQLLGAAEGFATWGAIYFQLKRGAKS
ncbi:MAG TPA: hypothetical protein VFL51_11045 [Pseudolabrys sp.]|nr:hypothetical protein [Pseudolabrys sp.]